MSQLSSSSFRFAVDGGKDGTFFNPDSVGVGNLGVAGGSGDSHKSDEVGCGVSGCPFEELKVQPATLNKSATAVTALKHRWLLLAKAVNLNIRTKTSIFK